MHRRPRLKKTGKPGSGRSRFRSARAVHRKPHIDIPAAKAVRSKYEKTCVEYFQQNGIAFQYEPVILLEGKQYRPDFFLPDMELFVEICGYNHMPQYRDRVGFKEKIYERNGLKALFVYYNGRGSLADLLKAGLEEFRE